MRILDWTILSCLNRLVSALPAPEGNATNNATSVHMLGAYHIENCRANYPRLVNVIDAAVAAIGPALADVKLGHQSRHGFRALFKYDGAKDYVEDMLKAVATMRPKLALEPWPMNQTPPQFSCVVRGAKDRYPFLDIDPWQYCKLGPLAAFYAPGTSFIFLCPRFFNTPDIPTDLTRRSCPGVQDNRWTYNERNLYDYQTYIIIHEMIHFYLQHQTLSGTTWPPEQYGIDGCVALSPLNSLHNPTSYQVYVAMVQHGCTQAPDPDRPPYRMPGNEIAIVPGLNITYMREQISLNSKLPGTTDNPGVAESVATA